MAGAYTQPTAMGTVSCKFLWLFRDLKTARLKRLEWAVRGTLLSGLRYRFLLIPCARVRVALTPVLRGALAGLSLPVMGWPTRLVRLSAFSSPAASQQFNKVACEGNGRVAPQHRLLGISIFRLCGTAH